MDSDTLTILAAVAVAVALLAEVAIYHTTEAWQRAAPMEACETCLEEGSAGVCCVLCGGCQPRADPQCDPRQQPPDLRSGTERESAAGGAAAE